MTRSKTLRRIMAEQIIAGEDKRQENIREALRIYGEPMLTEGRNVKDFRVLDRRLRKTQLEMKYWLNVLWWMMEDEDLRKGCLEPREPASGGHVLSFPVERT